MATLKIGFRSQQKEIELNTVNIPTAIEDVKTLLVEYFTINQKNQQPVIQIRYEGKVLKQLAITPKGVLVEF